MRAGIAFRVVVVLLALAGCTPGDDVTSEQSDAGAVAGARGAETTTVVRVVDGDTLVVGGDVRVRLIGIDTPEVHDPRTPVECFGREASRRMEQILPPGTAIRLEYDVERTDRYGRTLAYVYRAADDLFVNVALVRDGYAVVATYPPDVAHVDEIRDAERSAREANRGLWAACGG